MEIVYVYQRQRREFGRHPTFSDRLAEISTDVAPEPQYLRNYEERRRGQVDIQAIPDKSEHEVNTESFSFASKGILHTQGGWPKDVDATEVEHTIRYRKKVEKDDEYIKSVKNMGDVMEHCIKQNNAIDIYEEYFAQGTESLSATSAHAKSVNVFRDPNPVARPASCVSWYPDDGHKIAVAYSCLEFQKSPAGVSLDSYIWDVEYPNEPDMTLTPTSPISCLKYNFKDPHILVGGYYNGLVAFWDIRKGSYPADTSLMEKSHRDPVYGVSWISSKSGTEFFSVSTDGQVLWWDTRKLSEPTESLLLDPEKNGTVVGGTVLDFEATMPTKFMVGSENGNIFMCNKKSKNPNEKITHIYTGHYGPVCALQRNPFYPKNFLSVGDWTAKVWVEDVRSSMITTSNSTSYLTDGCWSTVRPSVFVTSKVDGSIDIWDYLLKQNEPALNFQVANSPLQCIKMNDHGNLLAATAKDGSTTIVELSDSLSKLQNNEKNIFSQMLEREAKREKTLDGIAREKRLKAQQKRPNSSNMRPTENTMNDILNSSENLFQTTSMGGEK